jgi:hypothetical protein
MLRETQGKAAETPSHAWPLTATTSAVAPMPDQFVSFPPSGLSTEGAVRTLRQILARPMRPTRDSLVRIALSRRVHLAVLTVPSWAKEARGRRILGLSLLSLQW